MSGTATNSKAMNDHTPRVFQIAFKSTALFRFEALLPAGNVIGSWMLTRLLQQRFQGEGILAGDCAACGELNAGFGLVKVTDLAKGVEGLKDELQRIVILYQTTIAWHDESEMVWRIVWPDAQKGNTVLEFLTVEMVTAEMQRGSRTICEAKEAVLEQLRRINEGRP